MFNNEHTDLIKFNQRNSLSLNSLVLKHSIKFATLYIPGALKDIRLYFRREMDSNSFLDNEYTKKILVKQSYMLLVWLNYLTKKYNPDETDEKKDLSSSEVKVPKFFIYPRNNYKTTLQKAPMAHKTFSQEQYTVCYYTLSISFAIKVKLGDYSTINSISSSFYPINGINNSIYYGSYLLYSIPYFSSNLLWLKKYSVIYLSRDENYFSYLKLYSKLN